MLAFAESLRDPILHKRIQIICMRFRTKSEDNIMYGQRSIFDPSNYVFRRNMLLKEAVFHYIFVPTNRTDVDLLGILRLVQSSGRSLNDLKAARDSLCEYRIKKPLTIDWIFIEDLIELLLEGMLVGVFSLISINIFYWILRNMFLFILCSSIDISIYLYCTIVCSIMKTLNIIVSSVFHNILPGKQHSRISIHFTDSIFWLRVHNKFK